MNGMTQNNMGLDTLLAPCYPSVTPVRRKTVAAQYPLTDFDQYLRSLNLSPTTRQQLLLAIRRAAKHVGPERLDDPQMLIYYRAALSDPMRGVFGGAWAKFIDWAKEAQGVWLPKTTETPRTRLLHPLMPDMADILTHWAPGRVALLRWGDPEVEDAPDIPHAAAMRAYEFITGTPPIKGDWLLPMRAKDDEPMPEWLMESILRADARQTAGAYEQFAADVMLGATRRGITAAQLKKLYAQLWTSRYALARAPGKLRKVRQALALEKDLPWGKSEQHIDNLCGSVVSTSEPIFYW
jgi:hypothetical protein